ncbi:glycosyltransferase [Limosilactobacillus reuteri]|uniref:glycosyltransferase n=1 Tax=Limosilactobacillus reuteri TaxID=1598 RepID=UPI001E53764A|nr:glycosyltransferase [Limosilactobacillus reuteri]MCC4328786.1 glycosyltransferase [Limosilactobacillus reuteri]MCC4335118.1 glycosyltransferase [Limosilactobacillus reuteri]MCC4339025.1 glycosyltransferase [Limosilactobacillus reuteri]
MNNKIVSTFPPFSVLISVYKKENPLYFDIALESIEKQSILPKEIILVKDGPVPKEINKVIEKHKKNYSNMYVIVSSETNEGLAESLRKGTKYVTTEYIARMDSDDICVPSRFKLQLKQFLKDDDLTLVGGQVEEFIRDSNNIVGIRKVPESNDLICDFLKYRNPFNHPTIMIKTKALVEVGGYLPFGNLEDYYLWARILSSGYKVKNVDKTLTYMRVDEGLYSRRGKLSNIIYFYKLRKYLREHSFVNRFEEILGDAIAIINIIIPSKIRKYIYQRMLHK